MKPDFGSLISKEEALARLFAAWTPTVQTERIPLAEAAGRVLAEDMTAQYNIPVVRASGMDGVAFDYDLVAEGLPDTTRWRLGEEFIRADTGDDFDDRYDTVVPIEAVTLLPGGGLTFAPEVELKRGMHVNPCGNQLKQGDILAMKGTVLNALDLGAIGMGGFCEVLVLKRPRVGFIPTGSELVPVGAALRRGQNFDANSAMVATLLREMGAEPVMHPIVRDEPAAIQAAFSALLPETDILILNAGTSKGGEDFCVRLLAESGQQLFHGVAAVPGRPISMAVIGGKAVLNISGPILAAFYSLEWAVRPIVSRTLGIAEPLRECVEAVLTRKVESPPISVLVRLAVKRREDGAYQAMPLAFRGSNAVSTAQVLTANGYVMTVPGQPSLEAGDTVTVTLVRGRETACLV